MKLMELLLQLTRLVVQRFKFQQTKIWRPTVPKFQESLSLHLYLPQVNSLRRLKMGRQLLFLSLFL
jgi:hypothetical protein